MQGTGVHLVDVTRFEVEFATLCAGFDPVRVPDCDVASTHDALSRIARLAAGAALRLCHRVEDTREWRDAGAKSAAHHLAKKTGSSLGDARRNLETSKRLSKLRATDRAVAAGRLSPQQAHHVAEGADAHPAAEEDLLGAAQDQTLGQLRDEAARAKAAGDCDAAARRRRLRRERYLRHHTTPDGAGEIHYRSTAEEAAEIMACLEPFVDRQFAGARATGVRERHDQYAADALLDLARTASAPGTTGAGAGAGRASAKLIFRVDWPTFVRGWPVGGETVEIAGVGPVPVAVVDEILASGDPFLAAVVTVGRDVVNVAHLGRQATRFQDTALQWRDPICVRAGCGQTWRLEKDHRDRWADTHITLVAGLDRLCTHDHDLKTRHGWALVAGTGKRAFVPPDDPRHPRWTQNQAHAPPANPAA